jgi:threonine/homoserine/homoserine lactone efflux protein
VYDLTLFVKATLAGFIVALPVGAIGAICLRRAFLGQWLDGVIIGTGAAIADSLLAAAASFGLSLVTTYVLEHKATVRLVGGVVLIGLGGRMLLHRGPPAAPALDAWIAPAQRWRAWLADFATGFALTIINPATLLAFVAVFAGLGLFAEDIESLVSHGSIVIGVFSGSMLWWLTLSGAAAMMRHRLPPRAIGILSRLLAVLVIALGVMSMASVVLPEQ